MRADLFLRSHTMVYTYCLLLLLAHRPDGSYYALWCLPRAPFCCLFAPSFAHVRSQRGDIVVFPEYRNKHPVMWRPASHGFNKLTTQPNPPHSLKLGSIRAHLVRAPTIPLAGGSVIGRTSRLPGPAGIYLCGHEDGCLVLCFVLCCPLAHAHNHAPLRKPIRRRLAVHAHERTSAHRRAVAVNMYHGRQLLMRVNASQPADTYARQLCTEVVTKLKHKKT